ncbi:hypothetical protein, partial [Acetobacter indonesiensis]|uniref:hypothetical protein n=1 Tax=Acetobacter indonesiensis TaxID=104101 RepID=UPI00066232CF
TNTQGAILSDAGSISIGGLSGQYAGAVLNQSGEIMAGSAAGDVTIHAASLTNNIINKGITVDQTATEIYYSQTYDQGLTGSLPTPADLGNSGKYYYGQKVLQIFTPT